MSVAIHDHFDGSAYCVECGGRCTLTGAELLLTQIVRYWIESSVYSHNFLPYMATAALKEAGVDLDKMKHRAEASTNNFLAR